MRRRTTLHPLVPLLSAAALAACGGGDGGPGSGPDGGPGGGGGGIDASIEDVDDRTTYVDTLAIPALDGETPTCCHDFGEISRDSIEDGTDNPDNALAVIANNPLVSLALDFQQVLDDTLESGSQVILLNHVGLIGPDDTFRMEGLTGSFAEGTTYQEASAGTGSFVVDAAAYDGSGSALIALTGSISAGFVDAGPSDFTFQLPFGDIAIPATVKEARISGEASLTDTGVAYESGELSGYILTDELFGALNTFATSCTCLGLDGDLFTPDQQGRYQGNCVEGASDLCPDDPNCATMAGTDIFAGEACSLIPDLIQNNADINLEGDATLYEGLSVGFQWTGKNASLTP